MLQNIKMAIFSKTAQTILIMLKEIMENISLNIIAYTISSGK
jgi:hypothetical protein